MKILFYINTLGKGGAERVVSNLVNYLSAFHDVTLLNSFKVNDEYPVEKSINHIYLDDNNCKSRLKKNYCRIKKLRRVLKKGAFDIAISFMAEPNFRLVIASIGLKNLRTIISVRNDPEREYSGFMGRIIGKVILPFANGCVFQTSDAKKWFPKKLQNKSKVILNAVEERFFTEAVCDDNRKDIVTCGRLTNQKNHKLLIEAFSIISNSTDDNLVIYGDGNMLNELKELVSKKNLEKRVLFAGTTNNVPAAIKNAKVFVLSSDYEGLPNVLMEAMTLGVPCISTDCPCGGPRSIIINGDDGVLVPVNDSNALAIAMKNLLDDSSFANKIGNNARKKAITDFNKNIIYGQWKDFIENA